MKRNFSYLQGISGALTLFAALSVSVFAEATPANEKAFIENSGGYGWIPIVVVVAGAMGVAFFFWKRSKTGVEQPQYNYGSRYKDYYGNASYELEGVDSDKELEWLRKAKKTTSKASNVTFEAKKLHRAVAPPAGRHQQGAGT